MLSGAADFIPKDNLKRFVPAVKRELKKYSQYQKQKIKATEHEEKFKSLAKTTDGIVWEADSDSLALEYVSPQIQNILGFPPDYWYENAEVWRNRVYKDDLERVVEFYNSLKEGSFYHIEFRIIRSDGSILWVKDSAAKYTSASGQKVLRGLLVDITEQKRKEIQLKQLLEEKENLLLEVHHRVKNNLAIVSGMMQLQMYSEGDERVRERLMDSVGRIKTMASIQETLYKSKSFTSLKIDEELNNLLEEIQSQFDPEYNIQVDLSTKEVELNVNQGIPLALIVFEIVSNAMKHAFNGINEPKIKVILKNLKDSVTLKIEDNGVGLPNEINKFEETKTLGLTITSALCEQIGAVPKLEFDENGTRFEISFVKSSRKGSSNAMLQN
jgi:PAS domain S-box-containing protein